MTQTNGNSNGQWYAAELLTNAVPALEQFHLCASTFIHRVSDGPDVIVFAPDTKAVARLSRNLAADCLHLLGLAKPAFQTVLDGQFAKVQAQQESTTEKETPHGHKPDRAN